MKFMLIAKVHLPEQMNKYIVILLIATSTFLPQPAFSQMQTVQFEQLDSLQIIEKRPVVVFLHTSWCKYCGTMKNTTLKNKEVERMLYQKFYFVSLDIEEKAAITFRGCTFRYKPNGPNTGVHELAEQLGTINGQLAYPGICLLSADFEIIHQQEGYLPAKDFLNLLKRAESLSGR